MRFSSIFAVLAAVVAVSAQTTPDAVVGDILDWQDRTNRIQEIAETIDQTNGPLIGTGQGPFPQLIDEYNKLGAEMRQTANRLKLTAEITAPDAAQVIFETFAEFVREQQIVLRILTERAALFSLAPLIGTKVQGALQGFGRDFGSIQTQLASSVPSRASDLAGQGFALFLALDIAIDAYDGLI